MKLIPHFYQKEAVQSIFDYFAKETGNPLVVMPTGTGKSIVIADFLETVYRHYPNQRIMMLTHVQELIEQNYLELLQLWPQAPAGIYSSGLGRKDSMSRLTFGGIQSVARAMDKFGHIDLLIIDEAHLVSPEEDTLYRALITFLKKTNPFLKVIGLTATPWRMGFGLLTNPGGIFTHICYDISGVHAFNKLIELGFLLPLVPKRTTLELDTEGLHTRGGDFIESEMQERFDKEEITEAALKEAMELGHDRRSWLIFCSGVQHAENTARILTSLGIPCAAIHSKISKEERRDRLRDFKAGRLRALTNNNVLTTGFNHKGLDLIIVLRATKSPILWVQILGRGTRPDYYPGSDLTTLEGRLLGITQSHKQNCLILDYARNTARLGAINDPVIPRKKGEKGGPAPIKCCEICSTYNHISARYCGGKAKTDPAFDPDLGCGAEFSFEIKIKDVASEDAVIKSDLPIIENMKVNHITYSKHEKVGSPPMMKATYYCGMRHFSEYVCPEHTGFAQHKARKWWSNRTNDPFPTSTTEMIELSGALPAATHLKVWINKQYPEIRDYCFDGTAFGTQAQDTTAPQVQVVNANLNPWAKRNQAAEQKPVDTSYDDDIPF